MKHKYTLALACLLLVGGLPRALAVDVLTVAVFRF
jgi:hypothetical protein